MSALNPRSRRQRTANANAIHDLWRAKEDAARLYQLYLCYLQMNRLHQRVVAVCPQIRRYAARGPGPTEGLFTFFFEIDSLCTLGDYQTAWRRLRSREKIIFGKQLNLRNFEWSSADADELAVSYAPLLFFQGRYRQGCTLLETALDFAFTGRNPRSFDLLRYVYNGVEEPRDRYRVKLSHFYDRLGKSLREWRHWEEFVNGFHPRLFRLSGVRREELLANPGQLPVFFDQLMKVLDERAGGSQSDLVESAAKVRQRRQAVNSKREAAFERLKPLQDRVNRKLQELFPELQGLPR